MRQITCPVCNSVPTDNPLAYQICTCPNCKTGWTYLPEAVDAADLYQDEVYAVVDNRLSIFERIIFFEAKKILRKARKLHPAAKSLLDFGSGKGQFLHIAKAEGWNGLGVETAQARANFAKVHYQVRVEAEYYSAGKLGAGEFDFVTMNHVLEHLPQPIDLVRELVAANLAEGGLVYIEVPRSNSWQANLAGKHWMHWDIPKHLTHWQEDALEAEMLKIGLVKKSDRRFSIHLGLMGMVQSLMSIVGFRDNLVLRLKRKKSLGLLLSIGVVLPFALVLELVSCIVNRSGIIGVYFESNG